jgi:hypothetical protein
MEPQIANLHDFETGSLLTGAGAGGSQPGLP